MPVNIDAWRLLQAGITQVRVAGMGGTIGFDYNALKLLADSMYIQMPEAMWHKVRAIENVIRRLENKARKEDEARRKPAQHHQVRPKRR